MNDGIATLDSNRHRIYCTHEAYPNRSVDLSELWVGASDDRAAKQRRTVWASGFRGRPVLADQLFNAISDYLVLKKPSVLAVTAHALRSFWRFLDRCEAAGFKPVDALSDIHSGHSVLWQQPPPNAPQSLPNQPNYVLIGKLIRRSRAAAGMNEPFAWEPLPHVERDEKDLPSEEVVREAMWLLKSEVRSTFSRWERADRLAKSGRNLLGVPRANLGRAPDGTYPLAYGEAVTEADLHATYRALIASSGVAVPTLSDLLSALGTSQKSTWWPKLGDDHPRAGTPLRWQDLVEGLYPNLKDVALAASLCMARSGWNTSTVLDLDISRPDWARPHGQLGSTLWLIQSFKGRSHEWQWTLSQEKLSTGMYAVVQQFAARSASLRVEAAVSQPGSGIDVLAQKSPWAYVLLRASSGVSANIGSVSVLSSDDSSPISSAWKQVVRHHNTTCEGRPAIPESFVPSDWRDIFAGFVFVQSRYSLLLLQWALGHKSMQSVKDYLRKKVWRRYSEKRVLELQTILIEGLEVSRRVDATIIRARLEHGFKPTADALQRLSNHRAVREEDLTYSGHGCVDNTRPPPEMDPGNPSDGTKRCQSGQRCASCPLGIAIDSFHMAKRVSELRWLRSRLSETVWTESHFPMDLASLQASLRQWPEESVIADVSYWDKEISAGRHRVLQFGPRR